jgi:hypothetical protein
MDELVFEVTQEGDGGYVAECIGDDIFTQADSWEQLRDNVVEAVRAFHFDSTPPKQVHLRFVRDEVLTTE